MRQRVKAIQIDRLRKLRPPPNGTPGQESPVWQHLEAHVCQLWDHTEMVPGKWYHTDETWAESYGPFDTEAEASAALRRYAATL